MVQSTITIRCNDQQQSADPPRRAVLIPDRVQLRDAKHQYHSEVKQGVRLFSIKTDIKCCLRGLKSQRCGAAENASPETVAIRVYPDGREEIIRWPCLERKMMSFCQRTDDIKLQKNKPSLMTFNNTGAGMISSLWGP